MCTQNELDKLLKAVANESKAVLKDKLHCVILFGSYARGDYDDNSDIDVMILADVDNEDVNRYTREIYDRVYKIEIVLDSVLSLCLVPQDRFYRFKDILPFYRNVDKEGVKVAI